MNTKQKLILARLRQQIKDNRAEERRLCVYNKTPENQHSWDQWMVQSGFVDGLISGLGSLEAFIEAGDDRIKGIE